MSIMVDVTERKRAEEALRAGEERYRSLYNDTPALMHSFDGDMRFISVSDYWLRVFGYERSEVIGRPLTDFVTEASRQLIAEEIPYFLSTSVVNAAPRQFVKKNGEIMDVQVLPIRFTPTPTRARVGANRI